MPVVEVDLGVSGVPAGGTLEASGPGIGVLETSTGAAGGAGVAAGDSDGTASKVGGILGLDSLFGSESTDILVLADASGAFAGLGAAGTSGTSIGFSASIGAVGTGVIIEVGNDGGGAEDKTGD